MKETIEELCHGNIILWLEKWSCNLEKCRFCEKSMLFL